MLMLIWKKMCHNRSSAPWPARACLLAVFLILPRPTSAQGQPDTASGINSARDTVGIPPLSLLTTGNQEAMLWGSYTRVTLDGHIPGPETQIRKGPMIVTAALYATAVVGLHIYQLHAWWRNDRGPFHFEEDWPTELQVDKFGHFFGGYFISYLSREALLESGFDDPSADDWGSAMGLAYQIYIEIEDGFSTEWGFSPSDAYADLAGAGYFFLQRRIPFLQNFHEKWTYFPSAFLGKGTLPGQHRTAIDDYEGQTYWWCADVWNLLPASMQGYYPKWLQVAIGYGAKYYGSENTDIPNTREVYIGLDYHLLHILLRTNSTLANWLVQTIDNFHFPAPAYEITPIGKFHLLYPFVFHIGRREL